MAIAFNNLSSLRLRFDCGVDDITGKSIIRTKTYSNVVFDALDDDVYLVATSIASLQDNTVLEVIKLDNTTLSE